MHADRLALDVARTVRSGPFAVVALGSVVWLFAFVGMLGVARTVFAGSTPALALGAADALVPWLPAFPGAACVEHRDEVFGAERVTELELQVARPLSEVRDHYHTALVSEGWTVHAPTWVRGELIYPIQRGERSGVLELEHHAGVTEIEVELSEPAGSGVVR